MLEHTSCQEWFLPVHQGGTGSSRRSSLFSKRGLIASKVVKLAPGIAVRSAIHTFPVVLPMAASAANGTPSNAFPILRLAIFLSAISSPLQLENIFDDPTRTTLNSLKCV